MRRILFLAVAVLVSLTPAVATAQTYGNPSSLVDSWYRAYLGRPADSGMTYWVNQLQQGTPPDSVLAGILASDEYYNKGGGTPQGFVTALFNDVLKRPPSPADLNFWMSRMYTESRQDIADEVLTQNPGVWVGANVTVQPAAPPVTAAPGVIVAPNWNWERDRRGDWDHHHEIHDYRRPVPPRHVDEHHHR
jgi:hypothetical protein